MDVFFFSRAAVAGVLCGVLTVQPVLAAGVSARSGQQVQGDARVLHALDRFTFGPRPGDVAAVEKMGLNRWFEQQLKPETIGDGALEAKLGEYPAARMPIAALEARYPGPQRIRAMESGKVALPLDPVERTIAQDEIAFYKMQKEKKAEAGGTVQTANRAAVANGEAANPAGKKRQIAAGFNALNEAGESASVEKPGAAAGDAMMAAPVAEGFPREWVTSLLAEGPEARYRSVMAMAPGDLVRLRGSLKGPDQAALVDGMTPVERETMEALGGSVRMVTAEADDTRLLRDVYSERQLEAVMTDFWLNHFNVYDRKNQVEPYLLSTYERETIRPHALGRFEDLLVATAQSPAMLVYLDNFRSIGPDSPAAGRVQRVGQLRPNGKPVKASAGLNENYGRELMELHTLGVNGGYTQADVTAVAKVFTGWTVDQPYGGGDEDAGGFKFDERKHEPGPKLVLGKTINEGGQKEGLEVLHMLATSPATAHFVCEKLAVRFVSDTPPPALVERMAKTFLKKNGDIKEVLRTMYKSPEFWAAGPHGGVERAKVKTPEEFVISAVRASGAQVTDPAGLVQSLSKLGMPLYGMQTPNGYSWKQDDWVSTGALVSRMNFALVMTAGKLPGVRTDWGARLGAKEVSSGAGEMEAREKRLELMLLGETVSERTRQTVLEQGGDDKVADQAATAFEVSGKGRKAAALGSPGGTDDTHVAVMAGLLLGSPEFQRR